MKKIFLSMLVIAFMSGAAFAANDGGKKKARKKAKTECKAEKCDPACCDPKNCDPKNCDPQNCSSKTVELTSATVQAKCPPASCSGN